MMVYTLIILELVLLDLVNIKKNFFLAVGLLFISKDYC